MTAQSNLKKDILVLNMEQQLEEVAMEMYDKDLAALTDQETYYVVLVYTKRLMEVSDRNEGEKKIYYISAEFLIGKLLSNNLINLGVYDKIDSILKKNGKNLSLIEEIEPEPSLGNGGLGRLAACFLDSIATLGLPGEGIGLNYHYGLFKQVFKDRLTGTPPRRSNPPPVGFLRLIPGKTESLGYTQPRHNAQITHGLFGYL